VLMIIKAILPTGNINQKFGRCLIVAPFFYINKKL